MVGAAVDLPAVEGGPLDRFRRSVGLQASQGVIANALAFRVGARIEGVDATLRAGEYLFPAAVSIADVVAILRQGKVLVRRLTVPEGLTSGQIVELGPHAALLQNPQGVYSRLYRLQFGDAGAAPAEQER